MDIKKIAITTGGGDAPGLNAVIRAAVKSAVGRGWEVYGIRDGFDSLLTPEDYPEGPLMRLDSKAVRGITHLGGTILGTTNRGNPMSYPVKQPDGSVKEVDRGDELIEKLRGFGIDALISIGGDGSMAIAKALNDRGMPIVGVPKTIDNDLDGTVVTFGFQTAVDFATDCIDRLHSTAESHRRIMVVEVMGRYAGWIALNAGVSGTADVILLPEIPYNIEFVAQKMRERVRSGAKFSIVVVAEGAKPAGGTHSVIGKEVGQAERLGGCAERVCKALSEMCGQEARHVVLGHLQRGGSPNALDRLLSLRFGAAAVRTLAKGVHGVMVALDPPVVKHIPLSEAISRMKTVPLDCDTVETARELGVSFGDEAFDRSGTTVTSQAGATV